MRRSSVLLCLISIILAGGSLHAQQSERQSLREHEMRRYTQLAKRAAYTARTADKYDVIHYQLNVRMLKSDTTFSGRVVMTCRSAVSRLDTIALNAGDMLVIDSVWIDGTPRPFVHVGDMLTVLPLTPPDINQSLKVTIKYSSPYAGSAITKRLVQNVDIMEQTTSISSQAEPYDARNWWPCKDDPADKADSIDITVVTDTDLVAVSNGVNISDIPNGDGTHTVQWRSKYPIVTYLVMVAIAKYSHNTFTFTHGSRTMEVGSWFYGMPASAMASSENDMLDGLKVYSDLFIPYPFLNEKYGMAEYEAYGGAMEHQTCSSMGFYGTGVVVHELSHQWFGDKVTCADFGHVWLNEGWATYCKALFYESKGGLPALKAEMAANAFYGAGTIFVEDAEDKGMSQIFDGNLSYNKASWVVHMLRHVVGDSAFFRAVRKYLGNEDRSTYRSAVTDEFQGYLERESGKNLTPIIQNWIYGEYFPTYKFMWSAAPGSGGYDVNVDIEQMYVPTRQIFNMPIDLYFKFDTFDTTIAVQNNTAMANYTFHLNVRPKSVQLDPDNWILKRVVQPVLNPTFDKGILLVNGVDWEVSDYTQDITTAYEDSIFTGNKTFTFWDTFEEPAAGYPSNIMAVEGHGAVPADEIGKYCTVVWIGNAYNGDDALWTNTSIWEYIKAGGNVILLSRLGKQFVNSDLQTFLGITWTGSGQNTIRGCIAEQLPLVNMAFTGQQNSVAVFSPVLTRPENVLLFRDTAASALMEGIGVWARPVLVEGDSTGQMVFLAMRPYRVDHQQMKQNMQFILDNMPCIPSPTPVEESETPSEMPALYQNYPNPVVSTRSSETIIRFSMPGNTPGRAVLKLYDPLGRLVREVLNAPVKPGMNSVTLSTERLAPGVYFYELTAGTSKLTRTLTIVK